MLEKKTDVSNAYLSQLENDKIKNPSPKILYKLAVFYNISYEYLLKLAGYPSKIQESVSLTPSFRISNNFSDLTDEEEKKLVEYLEFLRSMRKR